VRILFTCYPGFGHLHPMLPLARAALRAGHGVALATGPDLAPRAEAYGFDAWAVGLGSGETAERYRTLYPDSNELPAEERLRMVTPRMFVEIAARSRVAGLRERAARWDPELIIHDQSELAAPIVATALGTPTVVHSWGPMMPAELFELAKPALASLAAEHGVNDLSRVIEEPVYVDICPPSLQLPGGPEWKRIQPVRHEDPQAAPGEQLPAAASELPYSRTVYVTLGTVVNKLPGVFEAVLEGLAGVEVNAIVTVGMDGDPQRLGPQPAHVVVERYIPQALVLPRCRAMIAHAGAGTMLGALANGVPQLLLPHGAEQHLNAEACRRAGAALVLGPGEVGAQAIRAALLRILEEPSFADAARRLGDEIAAMPPADDALAALTGGFEAV